jgi:LTXXQ motif family protein
MKRAIIAAGVVFVLAGTTAVYAQHWPHWPSRWHHSFARSTDDMSAFADARIAAVKAGLRLNPEQEKLWPPVEAAARDLAKLRIDRVAARRERMRDRDASPDELFERFKRRADDMTASAAGMKKLAEASEPLYRSLNDDQKRRLVVLARLGGHHHRGHMMRHWRERTDFSAPDRDHRPFGRERERGDWPHQRPERI